MQLTIMGKRWLLQFVPWIDSKGSRGKCDPPSTPKKEIQVLERLHLPDWILPSCIIVGPEFGCRWWETAAPSEESVSPVRQFP